MRGPGADQIGPIDYMVVEFRGNHFNGEILPALIELIAAGTVRVLDLAFVSKDADGNVSVGELEDLADLGQLGELAGFLADLVTDEDLAAAAELIDVSCSAAVLVWENSWAAPFAAAIGGSGGEVIASGRLVGSAVLQALEAAAS